MNYFHKDFKVQNFCLYFLLQVNLNQLVMDNMNLSQIKIFNNITYQIHKCELLRNLYLLWSTLSIKEKNKINDIIFYIFHKNQYDIYLAIIKGFVFWDALQDSEGACGFRDIPTYIAKLTVTENRQIFLTLQATKNIVEMFIRKNIVHHEIVSSNLPQLKKQKIKELPLDLLGCGDVVVSEITNDKIKKN